MSLRAFHIVFIVVSVVLSLFVGLWGVRQFVDTRSVTGLTLAIIFLISGAALIVYGKKVYGKLKELG